MSEVIHGMNKSEEEISILSFEKPKQGEKLRITFGKTGYWITYEHHWAVFRDTRTPEEREKETKEREARETAFREMKKKLFNSVKSVSITFKDKHTIFLDLKDTRYKARIRWLIRDMLTDIVIPKLLHCDKYGYPDTLFDKTKKINYCLMERFLNE